VADGVAWSSLTNFDKGESLATALGEDIGVYELISEVGAGEDVKACESTNEPEGIKIINPKMTANIIFSRVPTDLSSSFSFCIPS
jgi:hypothetical protein